MPNTTPAFCASHQKFSKRLTPLPKSGSLFLLFISPWGYFCVAEQTQKYPHGDILCLRNKHNPTCGKNKKEERFIPNEKVFKHFAGYPYAGCHAAGDGDGG
ncbi:MAG: hypothetical protein ACLTY5_09655 [Angelakisella sp.]